MKKLPFAVSIRRKRKKVKQSLLRKTRLRPRNQKRHSREWVRAYHSVERVEFVKGLPCVATGYVGVSENAHIETGGTGRKADYTKIVPLNPIAHHMLHNGGIESFERFYGIDLQQAARETQDAWVRFKGGAE